MDAYSAYAYSTAVWLCLQALPLSLFPKLILTILWPDTRAPTDHEDYLSRALALTLFVFAQLNILLSGALPLKRLIDEAERSPYKRPAAIITTEFHLGSFIHVYLTYMTNNSVGFVLAMMGSGFLTCFGVWVLVFGGDNGGKSRVSGWLFRNDEEMKKR